MLAAGPVGWHSTHVETDYERILVIRGGGIGDFILTLPAIAALRRRFPKAAIEVLGNPGVAVLAQAGGLADSVRSIEAAGLAGFFMRGGPLDPDVARRLAGFELIVSYLSDPGGDFEANVRRCSAARFVACPNRPDESAGMHASWSLLAPLASLGITAADPIPRLEIAGAPTGRRILALHPGSGSEAKNWPEAGWAALAVRILRETDFDLLLVGGEAEKGRPGRIAAGLPVGRVDVADGLPLVELAGRLRSCAAFAGHDSGISHLAGALGIPCLLLWGETNAEVWRPPQERVTLLRGKDGLRSLDPALVMERLMAVEAG